MERGRGAWRAALVGLLVACAACGDDGDERLTRDEWRARAAAACERTRTELDAATGERDTLQRARRNAATIRELTAELRALRPPEEDERALRQTLEVLDEAVALGLAGVEAQRAGDRARAEELRRDAERLQERGRTLRPVSEAYGLSDCARA
jgi:hypothetical protein